jgi:4-amino-4-deoxy-L-arabinose transferase-like glycosyltransferase
MFLILLLGALLRIYSLGGESLWLDEATTVRRAAMSYSELRVDAGNGTQQPLYLWISKFWCGFAGTSETAMRFPAALFGILCILMIYHLGRKLFTPAAGLWAAFFAAISPYLIHYSQEARPYTLLALGAMASWYFMLGLLREVRPRYFIGYVLSTTAVLYTHPLGVLILLTHLAGFLIYRRVPGFRAARRDTRYIFAAAGAAVLLYMPQVFHLADQFSRKLAGTSAAGWIPAPGLIDLFRPMLDYFMDIKLAIIALLIAAAAALLRAAGDRNARPALVFCLSVWISFILLPWLLSLTVTPMFVIRYTIPVLPLVLIVLGWAIAGFEMLPRRIVAGLLVILTLFPLYDYYTKLDKVPWRQTFDRLKSEVRAGDLVICDPPWANPIVNYYFDPPGGVKLLFPQELISIDRAQRNARRIWLLRSYGKTAVSERLNSRFTSEWTLIKTRNFTDEYPLNPHAVFIAQLELDQYIKPEIIPDPEQTLP